MKKININKELSKLSQDEFKAWFDRRKKKGKFPEGEKWEEHYKILHPKKEAEKK